MSFGPDPWQQQHWDWRAAGNFIGGGAGSGLIVFALLAGSSGMARQVLVALALVLVGCGLLCVWAEIGRPLRALNVFFNPHTSWMSREAAVAPVLMISGAALVLGVAAVAPLLGLAALAFLYCQARIVQAAKGIAAWREPLTVPLLASTGLAEGAGLYWLLMPGLGMPSQPAWFAFGALLLLRFVLGVLWHRRLAGVLGRKALAAVNRAGHAFNGGSLLPLALVVLLLAAPLPSALQLALQMLAGALAVAGGAVFKYLLITRAGFNQGFALSHLPVRGVRR
jgi:phenylacetyl-CoA:acceptor oxidoreductase subunit 2